MKTLLPLICTIFFLSSCEKEEESTEINWETYSIRNETSSDLRIAGGTGAQAHFFEIKQGDEGAQQTRPFHHEGMHYPDQDGNPFLYDWNENKTIALGDSTLDISSCPSHFLMVIRSVNPTCYMVQHHDTISAVYTITDETIQRLVWYYNDKFNLDIVKRD